MPFFVIYHVDVDSMMDGRPTYPIKRVFSNRYEAEKIAREQPGYGLNIDWFVEEWSK
jgi:hypothetical protein